MKIQSNPLTANCSAEKLFGITNNCEIFANYLPEQVKNFSATENSCTFTIENLATVTLQILEKNPFNFIRYSAENDKNIPLFLDLNFDQLSENETNILIELDVNVPIFLRPLVEKPFTQFVELLAQKIKFAAEK